MFYIIISVIIGVVMYATKAEGELKVYEGEKNKLSIILAWYDMWIGFYRNKDRGISYIIFIPGIGFKLEEK